MKWVLIFNTKQSQYPSVFPKAPMLRHNDGDAKCFVALVEETTVERAWETVFTAYPDYRDRGYKRYSYLPERIGPNGEIMEHDIESIGKLYNL